MCAVFILPLVVLVNPSVVLPPPFSEDKTNPPRNRRAVTDRFCPCDTHAPSPSPIPPRSRTPPHTKQAANEARGLAMDSIAAAKSGHLGLPLGCAEMGAILFGTESGLNYNPTDPAWLNRDRFILSAGHGSMFVYSWLHLAGYEISLEEVKNFRQHHSMTPGHPEFPSSQHATPGIESTTGPLGQVTKKIPVWQH